MTGGSGFAISRNAAAGLPARCLNPECGNTYEVPDEGPIRCPYCKVQRPKELPKVLAYARNRYLRKPGAAS